MTNEVHPSQQIVLEAIDRIARTPDGAMLYVHLQRRLMSISTAQTDSALRADEGERRFAASLIGLMANGVFESGGRSGHTGSTLGPDGREQPLVVPTAKPVRVSGAGGSKRRVTTDTIVAGWNDSPGDQA